MAASGVGAKIAVVYSLGVLAAMTVSEAVPVLEDIARDLHPRSPAMIGLVMTLPSLVVALGALLAGFLVDRVGDKPILIAGSLILVCGDALVAAASSLQVLLAGRAISGVGYVLMAVSAITLLIRITEGKQRTMALALWSTFVPVSFIVPFLTAGLIVSSGTWRTAFYGHAAVVLMASLLAFRMLPPSPSVSSHVYSRTAGVGAVLRSPWPYVLGISFGADAFLHTGIISTLAPYLHAHYGSNPMQVNFWSIGAMISNAAGCLLLGSLLNRNFSPLRIGILATLCAGVPALLIYAFPIGAAATIACSWIFMFGSGVLTGMWAFVPSVAPSASSIGATGGLITQLTLLGVLLSGPVCFAAQASPNPMAMLTVVSAGLLFCLVRIPILIRGGEMRARLDPSAIPSVHG